MSTDSDWITAVISKSKAQNAKIPDFLWAQIEELLKNRLSQREIPAGELANIARQLIEGMISPQPIPDEQQ